MEIQTAGRQTERNRQKNNVDSPTDSTYTYCTVHGQAGKQTSRQIVVLLPDLPTPALPKTASFTSGLFAMAAGSDRNQNGPITELIDRTAGSGISDPSSVQDTGAGMSGKANHQIQL